MGTRLEKIITNVPCFLHFFIIAFCVSFIVCSLILELYKSQTYVERTDYKYCSECREYHAVTIYKKVEVIKCSEYGEHFKVGEIVPEKEYSDFTMQGLKICLYISLGISFLFAFKVMLQEDDSD